MNQITLEHEAVDSSVGIYECFSIFFDGDDETTLFLGIDDLRRLQTLVNEAITEFDNPRWAVTRTEPGDVYQEFADLFTVEETK
jgi:hypothetical protein